MFFLKIYYRNFIYLYILSYLILIKNLKTKKLFKLYNFYLVFKNYFFLILKNLNI